MHTQQAIKHFFIPPSNPHKRKKQPSRTQEPCLSPPPSQPAMQEPEPPSRISSTATPRNSKSLVFVPNNTCPA